MRALAALALTLATLPAQSRPASAASQPLLLVIAPARFAEPIGPFLAHKRLTGLAAQYVPLERVLRSEGSDDAERVKRFLFTMRGAEPALRYVLLVGDADTFPIRYMVLDRVTKEACDYAFYPSDLYFADLTKRDGSFEDWNARKDGCHARYFGEVRGEKNKNDAMNYDAIDYRPELAVGRWPVSTLEETERVVRKTIAFEKALALAPDRLARAAFFGVAGWIECRAALDAAAKSLPPSLAVERRYWRDPARDDGTPPPSEAELLGLLRGGIGYVFHAGHGEASGWAGCFDRRLLGKLTDTYASSIFFSIGCTTARCATLPPYEPYLDEDGGEHKGTVAGELFEQPPPAPACWQRGKLNPSSIGEQLVRECEHGAVAYIGCNTGGQPCAMTLLQGFCEACGTLDRPRLGDAFAHAVTRYFEKEHLAELRPTESWYPASIFFQAMKYMLYGDPSLVLPGAR